MPVSFHVCLNIVHFIRYSSMHCIHANTCLNIVHSSCRVRFQVSTFPCYQSLTEIAQSIGAVVDHWTPDLSDNGHLSFSVDKLKVNAHKEAMGCKASGCIKDAAGGWGSGLHIYFVVCMQARCWCIPCLPYALHAHMLSVCPTKPCMPAGTGAARQDKAGGGQLPPQPHRSHADSAAVEPTGWGGEGGGGLSVQ